MRQRSARVQMTNRPATISDVKCETIHARKIMTHFRHKQFTKDKYSRYEQQPLNYRLLVFCYLVVLFANIPKIILITKYKNTLRFKYHTADISSDS